DAGRLARDPDPQPRPRGRVRRRRRRHAVAQPARRRRLQVQSALGGPGRHRDDEGHRSAGERAAQGRHGGREADLVRTRARRLDVAFGNDADSDRHGIVTPSAGLLNPNHYLSVAIGYLFRHRPGWRADAAVGKTLVSSSMIDRVGADLGRRLVEVPVGFKWFVDGLLDGSLGFGGEESAGASFLRRDGTVWTTDKDGILLDLLAAEMTAVTGKHPGALYA